MSLAELFCGRSWRLVVYTLVCLAWPPAVAAAGVSSEDPNLSVGAKLMKKADAHLQAGEYPQAIDSFSQAIEISKRLDAELYNSLVARCPATLGLAEAHRLRYAASKVRADLCAADALYRVLLVECGATHLLPDELRHIQAQRSQWASQHFEQGGEAEIASIPDCQSSAVPSDPGPTTPETEKDSAPQQAPTRLRTTAVPPPQLQVALTQSLQPDVRLPGGSAKTRAWGIRLSVGGGLGVAGGLGAVLYAAVASNQVEKDAGLTPSTVHREFLGQRLPGLQAVWYGIGGSILALGTGAITSGLIMLARDRQRRRARAR